MTVSESESIFKLNFTFELAKKIPVEEVQVLVHKTYMCCEVQSSAPKTIQNCCCSKAAHSNGCFLRIHNDEGSQLSS